MSRRVMSVLTAILVSGISLAGCSSGADGSPSGTGTRGGASSPATGADAPLAATVANVTGNLQPAERDAVAASVGKVVDGWLGAAYLGDFPRSDYAPAFAAFTPGAAQKARRTLDLMTNAGLSDRIEEAKATSRSISLDVLAVKHRPVGVTATVALAFDTTGAVSGPQQVTGTLDLTPEGSGWKVFGFDITRTPSPAASAGTTETPESGS